MSNLSKLPVTNNQYLSVVMLLLGLDIPEVSSPTVELPLITVFYLLVILLNIGSLKTHGEPVSESTVISNLPETPIPVVSVTLLVSQLAQASDLIFSDIKKFYIICF